MQFCCSGRMCTWDLRMSLANGHSSRKVSLFSSIAMLSSSIKWYGCRIVLPWDKYLQFMAAKSSFYQNISSNKQTNKQTAVANIILHEEENFMCWSYRERMHRIWSRWSTREFCKFSLVLAMRVSRGFDDLMIIYSPGTQCISSDHSGCSGHMNSSLSKSPINP